MSGKLRTTSGLPCTSARWEEAEPGHPPRELTGWTLQRSRSCSSEASKPLLHGCYTLETSAPAACDRPEAEAASLAPEGEPTSAGSSGPGSVPPTTPGVHRARVRPGSCRGRRPPYQCCRRCGSIGRSMSGSTGASCQCGSGCGGTGCICRIERRRAARVISAVTTAMAPITRNGTSSRTVHSLTASTPIYSTLAVIRGSDLVPVSAWQPGTDRLRGLSLAAAGSPRTGGSFPGKGHLADAAPSTRTSRSTSTTRMARTPGRRRHLQPPSCCS